MNVMVGLVVGVGGGFALGWFLGRQKMEWQLADSTTRAWRAQHSFSPSGSWPATTTTQHVTHGYYD